MTNNANAELREVCKVCSDCVEEPCRVGTNDYCRECDRIERYIATKVLEAQLGMVEYFDQNPTNESMDWKGLFADTRTLVKYQLSELKQQEEDNE